MKKFLEVTLSSGAKCAINLESIVSFFSLTNGNTMVHLQGYFSHEITLNYDEFKTKYIEYRNKYKA